VDCPESGAGDGDGAGGATVMSVVPSRALARALGLFAVTATLYWVAVDLAMHFLEPEVQSHQSADECLRPGRLGQLDEHDVPGIGRIATGDWLRLGEDAASDPRDPGRVEGLPDCGGRNFRGRAVSDRGGLGCGAWICGVCAAGAVRIAECLDDCGWSSFEAIRWEGGLTRAVRRKGRAWLCPTHCDALAPGGTESPAQAEPAPPGGAQPEGGPLFGVGM